MKICMCADTYKRLLKWARKGGLKGALKIIRTKTKVQTANQKRKTDVAMRKAKKTGIRKGTGAKTNKQKKQQARFRAAAKKCKGKGKGFRPCMKRELKKRR